MQAWVVEQLGAMSLAERPDPVAGPGTYVVQVDAAGVNFSDILMIKGKYQRKPPLPFTPGVEIAGIVLEAGEGAPLRPGQRLFASLPSGGFAERALVPAAAARPIPDDVPSEAALVLLGINYPTSYHALHGRAAIRAGETVLVHAAAGGVGSAAVQIAVAAGCRVIATAGSPEKRETCRMLGAELVIDYAAADWVDTLRADFPDGVDVIYDPVGGSVGEQSLRALAWRGRYLVVGFAGGPITALAANRLLLKESAALGVFWGETRSREPEVAAQVSQEVLGLYRTGALDPLIGGRFPLGRAQNALDALGARRTVGKILITPT
ncbi:MAG: NADPH:quinone oxidoreductase family protein [Acetobacteraceae bacterium]|nr:NADPH:quinone oxidoreductase family protein [Acetobacteraceae bacterium]